MSKAEVFIIESLKFKEEQDYREGEMIHRALRMFLKDPRYCYVRTVAEFKHFIAEFVKSDYRFLHVSCHGKKAGVSTTLESMTTNEFAAIVGPALEGKRLFLSTCQAATRAMAEAVFAIGGCTSLAGPVGRINFDDSVILWTSFYHLMFKEDAEKMVRERIKQNLGICAKMVGEKVTFYRPLASRRALRVVLPVIRKPPRRNAAARRSIQSSK